MPYVIESTEWIQIKKKVKTYNMINDDQVACLFVLGNGEQNFQAEAERPLIK